jgi:hypothetical protein
MICFLAAAWNLGEETKDNSKFLRNPRVAGTDRIEIELIRKGSSAKAKSGGQQGSGSKRPGRREGLVEKHWQRGGSQSGGTA